MLSSFNLLNPYYLFPNLLSLFFTSFSLSISIITLLSIFLSFPLHLNYSPFPPCSPHSHFLSFLFPTPLDCPLLSFSSSLLSFPSLLSSSYSHFQSLYSLISLASLYSPLLTPIFCPLYTLLLLTAFYSLLHSYSAFLPCSPHSHFLSLIFTPLLRCPLLSSPLFFFSSFFSSYFHFLFFVSLLSIVTLYRPHPCSPFLSSFPFSVLYISYSL